MVAILGKIGRKFRASMHSMHTNGRKESPTPMGRTKLPEAPSWSTIADRIASLVLLDYYSRFIIASTVKSTDFKSMEQFFKRVFDQYGLPGAGLQKLLRQSRNKSGILMAGH